MKCSYCGNDVGYHDQNCSACGAPVPEKIKKTRDDRLRELEQLKAEREELRLGKIEELKNGKSSYDHSDGEECNTVKKTNIFKEILMRFLTPRYWWLNDDEYEKRRYLITYSILIGLFILLKTCSTCC